MLWTLQARGCGLQPTCRASLRLIFLFYADNIHNDNNSINNDNDNNDGNSSLSLIIIIIIITVTWPYLYVMVHVVDCPGSRLPTVGCSCSRPSCTMKSCSFSRSLRGRLGSTQFSTSTPTPISPTLCRSHSTGKLPAEAQEV